MIITDVTNSPRNPAYQSPEKPQAELGGITGAAKRALFAENSQADQSAACKTRKWTDETDQDTLSIFEETVPTDFSGWAQVNYSDGTSYIGDFVTGMRHGIGTLTLEDKTFIANWDKDAMRGVVEVRFNDGIRFIGRWDYGIRYDTGLSIYPDNSEYAGEFKDWMRHGPGEMLYSDGSSYKGWWKNDKPHGSGVAKYANGSVILGNFVDGQIHGKITLFCPGRDSQTLCYEYGKIISPTT